MSNEFKKFRRKQIAELRPLTVEELAAGRLIQTQKFNISISEVDAKNGSPKEGDMVARNPKNHDDQWLVAKKIF